MSENYKRVGVGWGVGDQWLVLLAHQCNPLTQEPLTNVVALTSHAGFLSGSILGMSVTNLK